jgi:hypothetical protein
MSNPKRTLPLLNAVTIHVESALTRPHIEQARRSLGGSASECASAGRVVEVEVAPGVRKNGVVLCTMDGTVDVWFGDRSVRRSPASRVSPANVDTSAMSDELLSASTDARIFGGLRVGERVCYRVGEGSVSEGTLVERCRYGGIVARDDGALLALGFRRLWPMRQE